MGDDRSRTLHHDRRRWQPGLGGDRFVVSAHDGETEIEGFEQQRCGPSRARLEVSEALENAFGPKQLSVSDLREISDYHLARNFDRHGSLLDHFLEVHAFALLRARPDFLMTR